MKPPIFDQTINYTLDFLFPPTCLICQEISPESRERSLCKNCSKKLIYFQTLLCGQCGVRLAKNQKICHKDTPFRLAPAARHESPIKDWVHRLKYRGERGYARPISSLMSDYLLALDFDFSSYLVMPVPLHKNRERARGFNQSEDLAILIAHNLNLPILSSAVKRVWMTEPQAKTKRISARTENITGAFSVIEPTKLKNEKILIVDDIFTSGGTVKELAKVVSQSGGKQIIAAVAGKTF